MTSGSSIPATVKLAYDAMPPPARKTLLAVRDIIFRVADDNKGLGGVDETLKWNQPSYVPRRPRTGSPRVWLNATLTGRFRE